MTAKKDETVGAKEVSIVVWTTQLLNFECPSCERKFTLEIKNGKKKLPAKCPCGTKLLIIVNARRSFRKTPKSTTSGFIQINKKTRATFQLKDFSQQGAGIEILSRDFSLGVGQIVQSIFNLEGTLYDVVSIIRSVRGRFVGLEFQNLQPLSKKGQKIGFYG